MKPKQVYRDLIDLPFTHRFFAEDGNVYEARHNEPGTWSMYKAVSGARWELIDIVHTDKKYPTCKDLYYLLFVGD